ncbi:MAG: acyl-CoA dehydrogenase family protein [Beijerinckiaceae bacterium]
MTAIAALEKPASDLQRVMADALSPLVRRIDAEGYYPETVMHALGAAGVFSHHADMQTATTGLASAADNMATVGTVCGSTAFCTWCQDALVWYLAASSNSGLQKRLLPQLSHGSTLGGTGLSNPMKSFSGLDQLALKGTRVPGGWRVTGKLPWVSNLGPNHFFASVFLAGERPVMAVFDCADAAISLVPGGTFIALEGTRTYSVLVRDAFVPDDNVLAEDGLTFVQKIRQGFVILQMGMAIGAARAAARHMHEDAGRRSVLAALPLSADTIDARADSLMARVHQRAKEALDASRSAFLETLKLRLAGSQLALEAAQANLIAHGARGYLKGSHAERLHREAHFIAIVSPSIKHMLTELQRG